jgi:NAD(P)-dependent dehydrogenase (short-subunit alcohol dehydrogenase family)
MEQWFENKVVLVTGGADGIGRAAALIFASRGAKVVIADLNASKGEAVVAEIRDHGGQAAFALTNVADRTAVENAVQLALDTFGRLDCAMNNAGITHSRDVEWDDEAFDLTIAVNLKGMMNCIRAEMPAMLLTGGGAIVNTSSTSGLVASATLPLPGYISSKHGVIGLTRASAMRYVKQNIRVNAVCPGVTDTEMVREIKELGEDVRKALDNYAPMGRMARAEEVAEAAVWLCSDKASFVTGHALVVDGGFVAI